MVEAVVGDLVVGNDDMVGDRLEPCLCLLCVSKLVPGCLFVDAGRTVSSLVDTNDEEEKSEEARTTFNKVEAKKNITRRRSRDMED